MKEKITILADCVRAEEGFFDSNQGLYVDFEIKKEKYVDFYLKLKEVEKFIKNLYPIVEFSNLEIGYEERPEGYVHLNYSATFDQIHHPDATSVVFNISLLATALYAYKIADIFQDELELNLSTPREIMIKLIEDTERYFLWEFTSRDILEYDSINFDNKNELEDFLTNLQNNNEYYLELMNNFSEECDLEFGVKYPYDNNLSLWEYSPLRTSDESFKKIETFTNRIQYKQMVELFKEYVGN